MGERTNNIAGNMAYLDNVKIDTCFTPKPTGDTLQTDSTLTIVGGFNISGTNLKWYTSNTSDVDYGDSLAVQDSTYYYITQTINGCESQPLVVHYIREKAEVVDSSTGILDIQFEHTLVGPNPFNNEIRVQTDLKFESIILMDVLGRIVKIYDPKILILSTADIKTGFYILKLNTKDGSENIKLIKKLIFQ